jgi:hypothetical protein
MKILFYILSIILFFSSCGNDSNDVKYIFYQDKYKSITEPSPASLSSLFLEKIEEADESSPFSKYSPKMINSQCSSIYRLKADELAELIIEILKYKKILSNDNDYSLKQLKSFVDRIRTGKQDKIDKIVIKSFDLMSAYKLEQLKLETKL